jgi:hypothetical protein
MRVVEAGRKGGFHGDASAPHGIGDFGVSVFHRPGCYRLTTSPLNQVCDSSVPSGHGAKSPFGMTAHAAQPSLDRFSDFHRFRYSGHTAGAK